MSDIEKSRIYTSTFTFRPGEFDDEFHRLDQDIAEMARRIDGYLGEESWENGATGAVSNIYYWNSLEALRQLMEHPTHLQAKAQQAKWLKGYSVTISQVLRTYGDADLCPVPAMNVTELSYE